MEAQMYYNKH